MASDGAGVTSVPADVVPGAFAKMFAGSGGSAFGWVSLGASLLSGSSMDKSGAFAQTESGAAWFQAKNGGGIKKPVLALDNPGSVLVAAGVVVGAVYLFKKLRGK